MDNQSDSDFDKRTLSDRDWDYWGIILDVIPAVLRAWKLVVVAMLAAGTIAYFMSSSRSYSSISYLGLFDEAKAKYVSSIIHSEPVLQVVSDKFPSYPQQGMPEASRREYLKNHIRLSPAMGSDPKRPSLYALEVLGSAPSELQEILSALVDALIPATKPQPDNAARLGRLMEATQTQISDLSAVMNELLKHPEQIAAKPGYFPPNVAEIIKFRADAIARTEEIKSELAGMSRDIIFSPPTVPNIYEKPRTIITVVIAMGLTFGALLVIIGLRQILIMIMRNPLYGAKMRQIREALPWQVARKSRP
jgi:hypothetical protein